MVRIYTYSKCSTCKSATRWLTKHGHLFTEIAIRQTPPSPQELKRMLKAQNSLKKLFNTSGLDYRALGLAKTFDTLTEAEAFALLLGNGNLVKRPFVISEKVQLTGFDDAVWTKAFNV
jgi:arsenate reductase (glutaredoxin)